MRKKAFKQSNNTSRTLLKQLEHAQKNDCRDIIGFFQEEVGSGEVGHLGHVGYSRRGLGRGLGQPAKKKFLVSRICYYQASSCCATFQLVIDGYLRIILSNDVSPNPGPVRILAQFVLEQLLQVNIKPYNVMSVKKMVPHWTKMWKCTSKDFTS